VPDHIALTSNATVVDFVPHGSVLDRAVCTITHGGIGGAQKALARGVPVRVVPFGRDQFGVVAGRGGRLRNPSAGQKLTPTRLSAKVLQATAITDAHGGSRKVSWRPARSLGVLT
jgi:UDP:flavonoid glycosyltransferase YjiC (YdhE family)